VHDLLERTRRLNEVTSRELYRLAEELFSCQEYGFTFELQDIAREIESTRDDGTEEEILAATADMSGEVSKRLTVISEEIQQLGLLAQSSLISRLAKQHSEISLLLSDDTNPMGIPLINRSK
jgi:hypothetical protein